MHPAWTAAACLLSLFLGMALMYAYRRRLPQHTGTGEGATNVWQLIDHIQAESAKSAEPTGKHHLHEPHEPAQLHAPAPGRRPEPPPLEVQRRVLESLKAL